MAELLRMPEISANVVEAVLNEWPLPEHASFSAGDAIATVETDKAVVDVPAESDGVLLRTLVEPGMSVAVGTPMAVLVAPGEQVDDVDALVARLTGEKPLRVSEEPRPAGTREVSQDGAGEVSQDGAGEASQDGAGEASQDGAGEASQDGAADMVGDRGAEPVPAVEGTAVRIFASPLARRIAQENGLDVGDIRGTGPGGRIVRDDVRRLLADRAAAQPVSAASLGVEPEPVASPANAAGPVTAGAPTTTQASASPAHVPSAPGRPLRRLAPAAVPKTPADPQPMRPATSDSASYRDIPHSRMRRAIATRLAASNRETPVFTIRGSARVDALLALRNDLNAATDVRISVNDLIVAAAARAHAAVPGMNVIWLPDAVRQFDDVDIAVAVATDGGLVTPVVRGVQRMTVSTLARAVADLVGRARTGRLRQDELEGGTLTVTNLGMFGTEDFTAVINPPQAAILAVGAARQEAVVTEGDLAVATVLRVTLSVDHRPVDGATAAEWMAALLALLESPLRILA